MMAASAELERNQNARQVKQKMKARLERGYWCFDYPPGLKYAKVADHGKLLVRDDPKALTIMEALEGFASGRMNDQTDVQKFLASRHFTHRAKAGTVHLEQVKRILTQVLYAGYVEYPEWGVTRRRGHHQGLINIETFERIQERLKGKARVPQRRDLNRDFPLRGHLLHRLQAPLHGKLEYGTRQGEASLLPLHRQGLRFLRKKHFTKDDGGRVFDSPAAVETQARCRRTHEGHHP